MKYLVKGYIYNEEMVVFNKKDIKNATEDEFKEITLALNIKNLEEILDMIKFEEKMRLENE